MDTNTLLRLAWTCGLSLGVAACSTDFSHDSHSEVRSFESKNGRTYNYLLTHTDSLDPERTVLSSEESSGLSEEQSTAATTTSGEETTPQNNEAQNMIVSTWNHWFEKALNLRASLDPDFAQQRKLDQLAVTATPEPQLIAKDSFDEVGSCYYTLASEKPLDLSNDEDFAFALQNMSPLQEDQQFVSLNDVERIFRSNGQLKSLYQSHIPLTTRVAAGFMSFLLLDGIVDAITHEGNGIVVKESKKLLPLFAEANHRDLGANSGWSKSNIAFSKAQVRILEAEYLAENVLRNRIFSRGGAKNPFHYINRSVLNQKATEITRTLCTAEKNGKMNQVMMVCMLAYINVLPFVTSLAAGLGSEVGAHLSRDRIQEDMRLAQLIGSAESMSNSNYLTAVQMGWLKKALLEAEVSSRACPTTAQLARTYRAEKGGSI